MTTTDRTTPPRQGKIFCIGLNKTGTTTLGVCLQQLGFRHTSFSLPLLEDVALAEHDRLFALVEAHDSFDDWPYPLVFELLDQRFPGSRFILSRRASAERWLESLSAHALRTDPLLGTRTRSLTYGHPYPQLAPAAHLAHYHSHLERVRHHFRERPTDLLEVCWELGSGWEEICSFLGCAVPTIPFPHANAKQLAEEGRWRRNLALLSWYKHVQTAGDPGRHQPPATNPSLPTQEPQPGEDS